jgi:alpha-L-fucosidase 2
MAELPLQSHLDEIDLPPALPKAWAKAGSVRGLCARDGFDVDIAWADGNLTQAVVRSRPGEAAVIRYGDQTIKLALKPGESATLDNGLKRRL